MSWKIEMPNPTEADLESPEFEAIWQLIKSWDVNVPSHYEGYCGANGSHVKMILDALRATPVVERQDLIAPYDAIFHAVSDSVDVISRGSISISVKDFLTSLAKNGYSVSPPAPVAMALPERKPIEHGKWRPIGFHEGWNACLDKVKELNCE